MKNRVEFALNHITAPRLTCRQFIDLAADLSCVGVELRNDLADKQLTNAVFFDGESPKAVGDYARSRGIRLLGLPEVYSFNRWSNDIRSKVERLIAEASESGAESISLIPSNDGAKHSDAQRAEDLQNALSKILPLLKAAKLVALVEPLGFTTSSLRHKREAVAAINAVGGSGHYKLVHDTFHHFLAAETEFFPAETGIVHISGVGDPGLSTEQMGDQHRILVDAHDRLRNIPQITELISSGYEGAFSYECFAPSVHASVALKQELGASFKLINAGIE